MSAPDQQSAAALACAGDVLQGAIAAPDCVDDESLRSILALAVRVYAAKAEQGMRTPLPEGGAGVSVDEAMVTVTDLLHALNVQLFELSMWQAMSGNCIAPHQRVDRPE